MENLDIVVTGCTKNSASYIKSHLLKLYEIRKLCRNFKILIYENDSGDNTLQVLRSIECEDIKIITETGVVQMIQQRYPQLRSAMTQRTSILAHARNKLLEAVLRDYSDYDYMIISDLDNVLKRFRARCITKAFEYDPSSWDVLTTNCIPFYYDIWALRIPKRMWSGTHGKIWDRFIDFDCWDMIGHSISRGFATTRSRSKNMVVVSASAGPQAPANILYSRFRREGIEMYVKPYQRIIPVTSGLISVESAFGGLGIYRINKLKGCRYSGLRDCCNSQKYGVIGSCRPDVCEHVEFHRQMRKKNGAKIFICPKLLISTQDEHVLDKNN